MTIIEQIKTEVERRIRSIENCPFIEAEFGAQEKRDGKLIAYKDLLSFLSTLEESERPEPYNPVYDEAYLNEKIKKATESWKGVDVDAMLAECRGYDEEKSGKPMNQDELEKEISIVLDDVDHEFFPVDPGEELDETDFINSLYRVARHFAEWGAEHLADARKISQEDLEEAAWDCVLDSVDVNNPVLLPKYKELLTYLFISGAKWQKEQMMKEAVEYEVWDFSVEACPHVNIALDNKQYRNGDKVRVIVLPKED